LNVVVKANTYFKGGKKKGSFKRYSQTPLVRTQKKKAIQMVGE